MCLSHMNRTSSIHIYYKDISIESVSSDICIKKEKFHFHFSYRTYTICKFFTSYSCTCTRKISSSYNLTNTNTQAQYDSVRERKRDRNFLSPVQIHIHECKKSAHSKCTITNEFKLEHKYKSTRGRRWRYVRIYCCYCTLSIKDWMFN